MALRVTLFNFKKVANSTAIPPESGSVTHVVLKDSTSFLTPQLVLQTVASDTNPTNWNYAYISDFKRFYFIRDWTYNHGLWTASLEVDVLGSWRDEIGGSVQYVLRSSHSFDGKVYDDVYPALADITYDASSVTPNPWDDNIALSEGGYVIGVISKETGAVGSTKYYYLKQSGINELCQALMDDTSWLGRDFGDVSDDMVKAVVNPFQYIISATWFPFTLPVLPVSRNFQAGWYEIPSIPCAPLSTVEFGKFGTVTIPKHPQAAERGVYLNCPPYTNYILSVGPFGEHQIDGRELTNDTSLTISILVDLMTGAANLVAKGATSQTVVLQTSGQLGIQIPLAQASNSIKSGSNIVGAMGAVAGASLTNGIGSRIGKWVAGVIGDLEAQTTGSKMGEVLTSLSNAPASALNVPVVQEVETSGVQGSIAAFQVAPALKAYFFTPAPEDKERYGRPLCQKMKISDIPGYIEVGNAQLALNATLQEQTAVVQQMERGFYYA